MAFARWHLWCFWLKNVFVLFCLFLAATCCPPSPPPPSGSPTLQGGGVQPARGTLGPEETPVKSHRKIAIKSYKMLSFLQTFPQKFFHSQFNQLSCSNLFAQCAVKGFILLCLKPHSLWQLVGCGAGIPGIGHIFFWRSVHERGMSPPMCVIKHVCCPSVNK